MHPYYHNGPEFEYVVRYRTEGETEWKEAVISDWRTNSFDISAGEYENIEYSVSVRNQEDDGPTPVQQGGTTGEGRKFVSIITVVAALVMIYLFFWFSTKVPSGGKSSIMLKILTMRKTP